jgi:hypothetical protein
MKKTIAILLTLVGCSALAQSDFSREPVAFSNIAIIKSPVIMKGIGSRSPGARGHALARYGGGASTEAAVYRCLRWLRKTQNDDGSWGGTMEPKTQATGLALLVFLKHGETPASVEFGATIEKGLKFLLSPPEDEPNGQEGDLTAIEHGIRSRALCEAYGMTRIPYLLPACTNAVNTILTAQRPSGLWSMRYEKEDGKDEVEASVWQMLAIKSALMAGLDAATLRPALKRGADALAPRIEDNGKTVGPAALCMQVAGQGHTATCKAAIASLDGLAMDWENPSFSNPVYHWYFITQAKFHHGGQAWAEWNRSFAPELVKRQSIEKEAIEIPHRRQDKKYDIGHWTSPGKGERYGTVYATALCCLMLENYYAYLPTFRALPESKEEEKDEDVEIESTCSDMGTQNITMQATFGGARTRPLGA